MIRVEGLRKTFGDLIVLEDVSVEIPAGECVSIIGPSGTGKSVFLTCLNALNTPDRGHVWIDGVDIYDRATDINRVRAGMGMVYQQFNLFSHMTVMENIILAPMKLKKLTRADAIQKAEELLDVVSLRSKANAYPHELSGGQQQRIAIARALAMEPRLMLLDEPTSALDPTMVGEVLSVIRALARRKMTMVIVTHEMDFARDVSDRILYMDERGIYEQGTPEQIFEHPQRPLTQAFIRKLKMLSALIDRQSFDLLGFFGEVEMFCAKYGIDQRMTRRIELLIEELSAYLLDIARVDRMTLVIEYADRDKSVQLRLQYSGRPVNLFEAEEEEAELGLMVIQGMSKASDWRYEDGENYVEISL